MTNWGKARARRCLPGGHPWVAHGGRGNSGVILSQLLRGFADGLDGGTPSGLADGSDLARALVIADELARKAVMRPVEGTILTVASGAADGARRAAADGRPLLDVAEAAHAGAGEALARTPSLLPVLEEAGVVDAGGAGYVLLFDALLHVLDDRPMPVPPKATVASAPDNRSGADRRADPARDGLSGPRYEVMYLLEAPDETIPSFKEVWAGVGDSIVVVGGDGLWNCHIHTDDIGAALEASMDAGRPRNIRVTDLLEEVEEERWVREAALTAGSGPAARRPGPAPATGVVAVASGDGIARIFRSLGVEGLIAGGQTMNPSVAELVEAVDALGSNEAVLLPNNGNIRPVADRVAELSHKPVWVIPTESVAEGFAALLAYDPEADGDVECRGHGGFGPAGGGRRDHPGRARRREHGRAHRPRRLARALSSGDRGGEQFARRGGVRAARGARDRGPRAGHHHRG